MIVFVIFMCVLSVMRDLMVRRKELSCVDVCNSQVLFGTDMERICFSKELRSIVRFWMRKVLCPVDSRFLRSEQCRQLLDL